jgi:hypothetical protein
MQYLALTGSAISSTGFGRITGIAPFKDEIPPYGDFANTTSNNKYKINQTQLWDGTLIASLGLPSTITWPSSEHAYHGQKLLEFRKNLAPNDPKITTINKMINQLSSDTKPVFLPNDYKTLVEANIATLGFANKTTFDKACLAEYHPTHSPASTLIVGGNNHGLPYTYNYMYHVVKMKLEQHQNLKNMAKEFALKGIMPVEISQHDQTWASFTHGKGLNYLGIIILELGNHFLQQEDNRQGIITDPRAAWNSLKSSGQYGYTNYSKYVSRGSFNQNASVWIDDATHNSTATPHHVATSSSSSQPQSSYQPPISFSNTTTQDPIIQHIMLNIGYSNVIKLERAKNQRPGEADVLKITFSDAASANNFATYLNLPKNSTKPPIKNNMNGQPVVILTEAIAKHFFHQTHIEIYAPVDEAWDALKKLEATYKKTRSSSPSITSSSSKRPRPNF